MSWMSPAERPAGQFGLADARLARDQRQPGVTGGRLAQGSREDGELT
jgi:hypothetical protein